MVLNLGNLIYSLLTHLLRYHFTYSGHQFLPAAAALNAPALLMSFEMLLKHPQKDSPM